MNNAMTYKGYVARIEFDPEDEIFFGRLAGVNDVVGFHADTAAGLKAAFRDAVDDYTDTCAKVGKPPEKPYSGQLMIRIDPAVHAEVAKAAQLAGESLAQWSEKRLHAAADQELKAVVAV